MSASEASPQHTPGPWHRCEAQPDAIVGPRCEPGTCAQCDELQLTFGELGPGEAWAKTYGDHFGGHFVCESVSSAANFNLIAAAPDLLAALESLLACVDATDAGDYAIIRIDRQAVRGMESLVLEALGRQP